MITGDHPETARSIAQEVGLLAAHGVVVDGRSLPASDLELAQALDCPDGAVVARVAPEDKLRIARALRAHGHVVAMTGDGVNDAPALREADVGVAMERRIVMSRPWESTPMSARWSAAISLGRSAVA